MSRPIVRARTRASLPAWHVGEPGEVEHSGHGVVAYDAAALEQAAGASAALPFHDAVVADDLARAGIVEVQVPEYRGKSFLRLLAWLASVRLGSDGADCRWRVDRPALARSAGQVLAAAGLPVKRSTRDVSRLSGRLSGPVAGSTPASFVTDLAGIRLELAADYGVFSPRRVDPGTLLLLDVAARFSPIESVADIGTGYGPLAIAFVASQMAATAVATEVDSVALWLASLNARAAGVEVDLRLHADPASLPPTELTVCNLPTHADADAVGPLLEGLAGRTRDGPALIVVHRSLEARYTSRLERFGVSVRSHPGEAHVVLEAR